MREIRDLVSGLDGMYAIAYDGTAWLLVEDGWQQLPPLPQFETVDALKAEIEMRVRESEQQFYNEGYRMAASNIKASDVYSWIMGAVFSCVVCALAVVLYTLF